MPEMGGYEVCRKLKADPRSADVPVIFLTVKSEVDDEVRGFELDAVDYIAKPMSPPIVKSRVKNHLLLAKAHKILENQAKMLELEVRQRTREIDRTQDVAIYCLASLAETRDNETGNHIRRTQHYVRTLSEYLVDHPVFRNYLSHEVAVNLILKQKDCHFDPDIVDTFAVLQGAFKNIAEKFKD